MVKETNPGWAAGIGQRSRAKQIGWALRGAPNRKKDLRINALSAIAEARKIRDRVTSLMRSAEAAPADARVYCVFVPQEAFAAPDLASDPDLDCLDAVHAPEIARLAAEDTKADLQLAARFADKVPVAFLVFVWDRDENWSGSEHELVWSIRPLIVEDARAATLAAAAMRSEKQRIETKLKETSGTFPDNED